MGGVEVDGEAAEEEGRGGLGVGGGMEEEEPIVLLVAVETWLFSESEEELTEEEDVWLLAVGDSALGVISHEFRGCALTACACESVLYETSRCVFEFVSAALSAFDPGRGRVPCEGLPVLGVHALLLGWRGVRASCWVGVFECCLFSVLRVLVVSGSLFGPDAGDFCPVGSASLLTSAGTALSCVG